MILKLPYKVRRSRLGAAWLLSVASRGVSLVPLALIAFSVRSQGLPEVRAYIITFAVVAAASYILNTLAESSLLSRTAVSITGAHHITLALITTALCLASLGPLAIENPFTVALPSSIACALQPWTSVARTKALDSDAYKIAYSATAARDLPAAVLSIIALVIDLRWASALPWGVAVGSVLQLMWLKSRDDRSALPTGSGAANTLVWAGISAFALAAFSPMIRVMVEGLARADSLALFELADRPAYVAALALAGGVGSELQRRWRDMTTSEVRREYKRVCFIWLTGMATSCVIVLAAVVLGRRFVDAMQDPLLPWLIVGTFIANSAYLVSVANTRFLMSLGRMHYAARGHLVGIGVALVTGLILASAELLLALPLCVALGHSTSAVIQRHSLRLADSQA